MVAEDGDPAVEDGECQALAGSAAEDGDELAHHAAGLALAAGQALELLDFVVGELLAGGGDQQSSPAIPARASTSTSTVSFTAIGTWGG